MGWYGSAYLLTVSALQLFFGRLYSFYSIKWTYLIALAIFEVSRSFAGFVSANQTLLDTDIYS